MKISLTTSMALACFCCITDAAAATNGRVKYVTASEAYLDMGTEGGVQVDDVLLLRGSPRQARCRVVAASEHSARCAGTFLPLHASFTPLREAPVHKERLVKPEEFPPAKLLDRARHKLATTTFAPIPYRGLTTSSPLKTRGWVSVSHNAWGVFTPTSFSSQNIRLDVGMRAGPRSYPDLTFGTRFSLLTWLTRSPTERIDAQNQFFLWEGDIVMRGMQNNVAFAIGRIMPYFVPGIAFLDGVQLGYRGDDGSFEIGAYGGGLPTLTAMVPNFQRWAGGMYFNYNDPRAGEWRLATSGRIGYLNIGPVLSRAEVEVLGEIIHKNGMRLALGPRFGVPVAGGAFQNLALELLRGDLTWQAGDEWRFVLDGRWQSGALVAVDNLVTYPSQMRTTAYASGSATYQPTAALLLSGVAMYAYDDATQTNHTSIGPEISVPMLFGSVGGMGAGYLYELGTRVGGTAYVQSALSPVERIHLWMRATWFTSSLQNQLVHEVGVFINGDAALLDWLTLSWRLSARHAIEHTAPGLGLSGVTSSLALTGRL